MTENYLVLDDVYYWYLEEVQYATSARQRLHQLLKEGKNVVLLQTPTKKNYWSFNYTIYERGESV